MSARRLAILACVLGSACRGQEWVVAEEVPSTGAPGGGGQSGDVDPMLLPPDCPTAAELLAERAERIAPASVDERHAGRWSGTLTGSAVPGFPSSRVELSLAADGSGSFVFTGVSLPPPADSESGYLCGAAVDGAACGTLSGFVGGYPYRVERVTSRGDVLSFAVVEYEPWNDWCALHPPVRWVDPGRECGYEFGVLPPGTVTESSDGCARVSIEGELTPIDCALLAALARCECGADACFAGRERSIDVGLELVEGGVSLRGSLWYSGDLDAARLELARE